MRNKFDKKMIIIFLVLVISSGFAFLSSNLFINGTIGYKESKWNVYFDNIQVEKNDISAGLPTIEEDKTTIMFGGTFNVPGEIFEFSIDVVNDGTIDAMLNEITKIGITNENSEYLSFDINYYDDSEIEKYDLLKKNSRVKLNIKVEYKYDINEFPTFNDQTFSLELYYVSATKETIDRKNTFDFSENSSVTVLDNVKEDSMFDLRIYGNSEQNKYNGYQLIRKNGLSTPKTDTDFWADTTHSTPLTNGWIRASFNNVNDYQVYCNFMIKKEAVNLKPDTEYTVFVEYKNFSGTGSIILTQTSMWKNDPFVSAPNGAAFNLSSTSPPSGNKKFLFVTKSDLTGTLGLRGFTSVSSGNNFSVDIRVMIMKGNHIDEELLYEPYVGGAPSPSPEYPQEVRSVSGDMSLNIIGKNLFNKNLVTQGVYFTNSGDEYPNAAWNVSDFIQVKENTNYTFHWDSDSNFFQAKAFFYDSDKKLISSNDLAGHNIYEFTFLTPENTKYVRMLYSVQVSGTDVLRDNIQLEESNKFTSYEEYKGASYTISLGDLELYGSKNYRDYIHRINGEWYVHREMTKTIVDGSNIKVIKSMRMPDDRFEFGYMYHNSVRIDSPSVVFDGFSDKLIATSRDSTWFDRVENGIAPVDNDGIIGNQDSPGAYGTGHVIYIRDNAKMTLDEMNEWLKSNPITIYHPINNYYEEKIFDNNLINQLNAIIEGNLNDGYNYISYDGNISSKIDFNYIKK